MDDRSVGWTAANCAAEPCETDGYAAVGDEFRRPWPGGRGTCLRCGGEKIAKCGARIRAHWAHRPDGDWDKWSERETEWHRAWKNYFPSEWHERLHTDRVTGERHRSDIGTPKGLFIEVQNSPMSDAERRSREAFYKNLIWVVNAEPFRHAFQICHRLPHPTAEGAIDLVWYPAEPGKLGTIDGMCWRRSENPHADGAAGQLVKILGWQERDRILDATYCGHHQFTWVRPRGGWLDASCPVFFDFHDGLLWKLEHYGGSGLRSVRAVRVETFISDAFLSRDASEVGAVS